MEGWGNAEIIPYMVIEFLAMLGAALIVFRILIALSQRGSDAGYTRDKQSTPTPPPSFRR